MSTAVAEIVGATMPIPQPSSETAAIIGMIERAARDPSVDIAKMERLFEMHERMLATQAKRAYLAAFSTMQPSLPTIGRHGVIKTNVKDDRGNKTGEQTKQSSYALWEDIETACRPVYTAHGFSLSFRVSQTPDRLTVTAVLGHRDGHAEEASVGLPIDTSGSKNNVQGWGSALSYGKRYSACAILNIISRGEDDDGKKAGAPEPITIEQADQLREMLEATESDRKAFCRHFKIDKVEDLPATELARAMAALTMKAARK